MPNYKNAYQQSLLKARLSVLTKHGIPKRANELLLQVFARAIEDINKDFGSGAINSERVVQLKRAVNDRMIDLGRRLSIVLDNQKNAAMQVAIEGHAKGLAQVQVITGVTIKSNFNGIAAEALEQMMVRRGIFGAKDYASVINRNLQGVAKDIDMIINSAVTRGVSSARASQEIAAVFVSNDKSGELQKLIDKGRLKKSELNAALKEGNITPEMYKRAKSAFNDANRIMVTEINTAYREADLVAQERSPIVKGTKWNLSGRHSVPDVCDLYAEADMFGLGAGVYPVGNYPGTPHPYCGCYPTAVLADISEWSKPKEIAQSPPRAKKSTYSKLFKGQSDHYAQTQIDNANKYLALAYEASKKKWSLEKIKEGLEKPILSVVNFPNEWKE